MSTLHLSRNFHDIRQQWQVSRYLVLGAILLAGRRGVTATNHGDDTLASGLNHGIHELLGALDGHALEPRWVSKKLQ